MRSFLSLSAAAAILAAGALSLGACGSKNTGLSCFGANCTCAQGGSCTLSFANVPGDLDCFGGSSCNASCAAGSCDFRCMDGAGCSFSCQGGACDVQSDGNSSMNVTCSGGGCDVQISADGGLDCGPFDNCNVSCGDGSPTSCGGGVYVCGRTSC